MFGAGWVLAAEDVGKDQSKCTMLLKTFHQEFVQITPGKGKFPKSFEMGSQNGSSHEKPVHCVTFQHDFWMAKYEVPQNLYEAVMGENPSKWKGPRNSVEMMEIRHAVEFCRQATNLLREAKLIGENEEIRLPSESEWEYCCRAGTTTEYSFGDRATAEKDSKNKASILDPYGWHTGNAAGNDPPVGALKPNAWGLYDMHGYLWEFVGDRWQDDYSKVPKAELAKKGAIILRGGSWKDRFEKLRSSTRRRAENTLSDDAVGFRCVKSRVKSQ